MAQNASEEDIEKAFQEIHSSTAQDSTVLMNLIMNLESYLTSTEDKERNRATLLLAKLLELQHKPLSASEIHHFCVFFNSRIADYPSLSPCLRALRGIIEHQWMHFDEKYLDVKDIFDSVFKELQVGSDRQAVSTCLNKTHSYQNTFICTHACLYITYTPFLTTHHSPSPCPLIHI